MSLHTVYFVLLVVTTSSVVYCQVEVTLNGGGKLTGKSVAINDNQFDLFLGVRYAKAPTGDLRFKRPEQYDPSMDQKAQQIGSSCYQHSMLPGGPDVGSEDCLFLDITVPGGVTPGGKKSVMVWIHGGGYVTGSGSIYVGAALANAGDVIVVVINYRLNVFGFLFDGPETGNFGLWDQQLALTWVKANIENFGGNPESITIFGESAGGGSVSAQIMGQANAQKGLFQRAIQQSGSLLAPWGWFLTDRVADLIKESIREETKCCANKTKSIYDCLATYSTSEVYEIISDVEKKYPSSWIPTSDDSFFPSDIKSEEYDFPNEVDLMSGFNGQEGGLFMNWQVFHMNLSATGVSQTLAETHINMLCSQMNPLTPQDCAKFLDEEYGISTADNDQQRGVRLSFIFGELYFNADSVRQLRKHAETAANTYAYYFTHVNENPPAFWESPAWLKVSADHAEEIPYMFGAAEMGDNKTAAEVTTAYFDSADSSETEYLSFFAMSPTSGDTEISDVMMRAWTNFAKTGDPNSPNPLPNSVPTWIEFGTDENFLRLDSGNFSIIQTPEKDRLDKIIDGIFANRTKQLKSTKFEGLNTSAVPCGAAWLRVTEIHLLVLTALAALITS